MSEESIRFRASDAEREQVAAALRQAMSEGRLTLAEGEQRLVAAYATTYRDELPSITADLPPAEPAGDSAGESPRRERRSPRRFRPPVGPVTLVAVAIAVWAIAAGGPVWPAIVLGVLALVLVKHRGHHGGGRAACARGRARDGAPAR